MLLVVLWAWALQRWVRVVLGGVALLLLGSFAWQSPALPQADEKLVSRETALQVATANLNLNTTDFSALQVWLSGPQAPDVVFFQEFTPLAQQALEQPALLARYPHRLMRAQSDPFGLAILSQHVLINPQVLPGTFTATEAFSTLRLRATLVWQGQAVRLSAMHPMPPISAADARQRDLDLRAEANELSASAGLALLVGDLNVTPWAHGLFALAPGLRRATGVAGSWPQVGGWLSVLPLDHVLASEGWRLAERVTGPHVGSDHRPQVVRLLKVPTTE